MQLTVIYYVGVFEDFYVSRFYSFCNPALPTLLQFVLKFHSPLIDWIRIGHIYWTLNYLSDWTHG